MASHTMVRFELGRTFSIDTCICCFVSSFPVVAFLLSFVVLFPPFLSLHFFCLLSFVVLFPPFLSLHFFCHFLSFPFHFLFILRLCDS
jgi:hypothetical protein